MAGMTLGLLWAVFGIHFIVCLVLFLKHRKTSYLLLAAAFLLFVAATAIPTQPIRFEVFGRSPDFFLKLAAWAFALAGTVRLLVEKRICKNHKDSQKSDL